MRHNIEVVRKSEEISKELPESPSLASYREGYLKGLEFANSTRNNEFEIIQYLERLTKYKNKIAEDKKLLEELSEEEHSSYLARFTGSIDAIHWFLEPPEVKDVLQHDIEELVRERQTCRKRVEELNKKIDRLVAIKNTL